MKKGGLGSRLIVAAWGIPLLLGLTYLGDYWTAMLILGIAAAAQSEYYKILTAMDYHPMFIPGLVGGAVVVAAWHIGIEYLGWVLVLMIPLIMLGGLIGTRRHTDVMATIAGICYTPLLAGAFIFIRGWQSADPLQNEGRWLAFCVFGAIWVGDTAAYFGGRAFGKHKLAPNISPKKTVEGFVFGLVGAVLFGYICYTVGLVRLDISLVVGLTAGTFGQLGDLVESRIKREAGVKDSGTLLPGHGGLLDRFDSLMTTAPIVALYLLFR